MNTYFEIYLARFKDWIKTQGWSLRTLEGYLSEIRFFLTYLENETTLTSFNDVDIKLLSAYQNYLYSQTSKSGKRLSLATLAKKLSALRTFFRFLYQTDVILFDPSAALIRPKTGRKLPRGIMSEGQIKKLMQQPDLKNPLEFRDRTMLELLYATGIRNSELRGLHLFDIDLPELKIIIRKGKGSKERIVPLGEIAAGFLQEYITTIRTKLTADLQNEYLFVSKNGRQITVGNLIWIFEKYAKRAGLEKQFTPHSLRHSCATHMLKHGADLRYIQEMLGHASEATTQIYTRVEPKDLREVHRRFHPRERFNDES
jgi:integrase/recombinase XerD